MHIMYSTTLEIIPHTGDGLNQVITKSKSGTNQYNKLKPHLKWAFQKSVFISTIR